MIKVMASYAYKTRSLTPKLISALQDSRRSPFSCHSKGMPHPSASFFCFPAWLCVTPARSSSRVLSSFPFFKKFKVYRRPSFYKVRHKRSEFSRTCIIKYRVRSSLREDKAASGAGSQPATQAAASFKQTVYWEPLVEAGLVKFLWEF